jgi:hypothetical protein
MESSVAGSAYIRQAVGIDAVGRSPIDYEERWPRAEGERREWSELPRPVRDALEDHLHARVVRAESEAGGFSPGVAARLELSDGRRVFAKVVGGDGNPDSPGIHRTEARILVQMPRTVPVPRLLSVYDDGHWIALFLQEVDGHTPPLPWKSSDLRTVVRAIESLAERLTPAPFPALTFGEKYREVFTLWREMAAAAKHHPNSLRGIDPWARGRLPQLVKLERRFEAASLGDTLLHSDLRADNILLSKDRVYFADWPGACVGARWVDLLGFLPSVAMQGGPRPWTIFDKSRLTEGVEGEDVDSVLAALTGYFVGSARKPPPPGLSTLRPFQAAQGVEALMWLKHRLGGG